MLSSRLAPNASNTAGVADTPTAAPPRGSIAPHLAARGTVTLGTMMMGPQRPTSAQTGPASRVSRSSELDAYLAARGIENRNGRLDPHELAPISGGWSGQARLLPPAAAAWEEMRAAAAAEGIDLRVVDSYRTYEAQDHAHRAHVRGEKAANVLPPGTSEHGNGLAVDVTNGAIIDRADPEWAWLERNARRFGWYPISNETWHWEFRGTPG